MDFVINFNLQVTFIHWRESQVMTDERVQRTAPIKWKFGCEDKRHGWAHPPHHHQPPPWPTRLSSSIKWRRLQEAEDREIWREKWSGGFRCQRLNFTPTSMDPSETPLYCQRFHPLLTLRLSAFFSNYFIHKFCS